MAKVIRVAKVSDLLPGQGKVVQAEGIMIALFNVNGEFYAIHNACLHLGGPLGEGRLEGTTVTCPWHGWRYDVTNGHNVRNPDPRARLPSFSVTVKGADVLVELPESLIDTDEKGRCRPFSNERSMNLT